METIACYKNVLRVINVLHLTDPILVNASKLILRNSGSFLFRLNERLGKHFAVLNEKALERRRVPFVDKIWQLSFYHSVIEMNE